uniref:Virulence plasmid protein pGP3-D n=1 Tax=Chlamydia trachomatis TaxID=813 RepID=UPI0003349029
MGNSGFYLYNTENCVFADNIKVGQMTEPLKDQQIILGTKSTPVAAKMTASDGISLTVSNNSSTNASITIGLLKAFNNFPITNKIQCNGLFTPSNIETLLGGTEIGKFTVTPKSSGSMFLVSADIIASRMEGGVVLALVREGDSKPCAISYGYSSGVPNLCSLRTSITNTGLTPTTYSLRVGGLESGVVWVNALSNGNDILGITNTSNVSFLEVIPQTNA